MGYGHLVRPPRYRKLMPGDLVKTDGSFQLYKVECVLDGRVIVLNNLGEESRSYPLNEIRLATLEDKVDFLVRRILEDR